MWLTPFLLGSGGSAAGSPRAAAKTVLRGSCRLQRKHCSPCTPRGALFGDAPPFRAALLGTRSAAAEPLAAACPRSAVSPSGQKGGALGCKCTMELALIWSKAVSWTPGGTQTCAPEGPPAPGSPVATPHTIPLQDASLFLFWVFFFNILFICLFLPRWVLVAAPRLSLVAEAEATLQLPSAGFSLG